MGSESVVSQVLIVASHLLRWITVIAFLLLFAFNFVVLFILGSYVTWFQFHARAIAAAFALFCICVELNVLRNFVRQWAAFMLLWYGKGIVYLYLGCAGGPDNLPNIDDDLLTTPYALCYASATVLSISGTIYVAMGIIFHKQLLASDGAIEHVSAGSSLGGGYNNMVSHPAGFSSGVGDSSAVAAASDGDGARAMISVPGDKTALKDSGTSYGSYTAVP